MTNKKEEKIVLNGVELPFSLRVAVLARFMSADGLINLVTEYRKNKKTINEGLYYKPTTQEIEDWRQWAKGNLSDRELADKWGMSKSGIYSRACRIGKIVYSADNK